MDKKRAREPNFSSEDRLKLVEIVQRHQSVIECKKTDAQTWREKAAEWDLVTSEFNATSLTVRGKASLKLKYELLKKEARQRSAKLRQEQLKTGGGPPKSPKRDHVLDIVEGMIPLSTCGLQSTVDSDFMANNICEDDPDDELQPLNDIFDESTIGDYIVVEDPVLSSHTQEGLSDTVGGSSTVVRSQSATIPESVNVWDRYTPSMLRQAKHPSLQRPQSSLTESGNGPTNWTRRRRPTLPQRQLAAQSVSTTKFASMAEAKADLAILQSEHMKEEREENRKLFNLEVKIKEAQLESLQLDIQLKKTQLEKLQSSHFQN